MKQTKADLIANITRDLADNATQEISPKDVRQNMLDLVDSVSNLLITEEIVSTNFSTPATRTTIAGEDVLHKLGQESYVSSDNSAFGFSALKQNFQGEKNTAVGGYALSCNIYGTDNVAVGYSAVTGNSNGTANVGIGNYSLYYNKLGNFNVAIGHGAGYYADREDSSKLYIGVHPVTEQYVCDNPEGVGLTPLVHGDFELGFFGVNVNEFHPYGSVQVSGAISPSQDEQFDLGHADYAFKDVHSRGISFYEGNSHTYDPTNDVVLVSGVHHHADDIKPSVDTVYSLGSPTQRWRNTHTYDLTVDGTATINEYKAVTSCLYECKTLYLATSGVCEGEVNPCGYLSEGELNNAGLIIPTSGVDGLADYKWVITASGLSVQNIVPGTATLEEKAYWTSNNNILLSGDAGHIRAAKYLSQDDGSAAFGGMVNNAGNGFGGLNVVQDSSYQRLVFTTNDGFDDVTSRSLDDAGDGDFVSFYSAYTFNVNSTAEDTASRAINSRRLTVNTPDLDVPVSLNLNHGTAYKRGVEFYSTSSGTTPGLYISTYDGTNTDNSINTVSIMQDSDITGGVLGVHNFAGQDTNKYPETIINARSDSDAALRITAENGGNVTAALELCGELNCLEDAGEVVFHKQSGVMQLSTYLDSGRVEHITMKHTLLGEGLGVWNQEPEIADDKLVTFGSSGDPVGLSLSNIPSGNTPTGTTGFTKLFAREVIGDPNQTSELIYIDDDDNLFPLSLVTDNATAVYSDGTNTFTGSGCPDNRANIVTASGNTGYGAGTLFATSSGDPQNVLNVAMGYKAGHGMMHSQGNILLGNETIMTSVSGIENNILLGNNLMVTGDNNIVLGNNVKHVNSNNNIILGNVNVSGIPNARFIVGVNDNILVSGVLNDPNNRLLTMPSGGEFRLYNADHSEYTTTSDHLIEVVGSGSRYGETPLRIRFSGNGTGLTNDLVTLDHSSHYTMNNSEDYETTNPRRPFMHLDGDLRLRGALRMADGTSLTTASGINDIQSLIDGLQAQIDIQTIEGTMLEDVDYPTSSLSPTTGLMKQLNGDSETITLRDQYLRLEEGDYVIASRIRNTFGDWEYRPVWVSNEYNTCGCARPSTLDGGNVSE